MAHTVVTKNQTTLTWINPHGGDSHAVIVNGAVTEFVISSATGGNIIYSTDTVDLTHLNNVLTELLAALVPE